MISFPPARLRWEYADALNRGDRGWLEALLAATVSACALARVDPVASGPRDVAETLVRAARDGALLGGGGAERPAMQGSAAGADVAPAPAHGGSAPPLAGGRGVGSEQVAVETVQRRGMGTWDGEPVVVVWAGAATKAGDVGDACDRDALGAACWRAVAIETLSLTNEGIAGVTQRSAPDDLRALVAAPPAEPPAPITRAAVLAEVRAVPAEVAIGVHHVGTYFDFAVDPLFAPILRWLDAQRVQATGPWLALFDDPTRYPGNACPFTVAVSVGATLSELPRPARSLTVVHPWLAEGSWKGPAGEITAVAMPSVTVGALRRPAWRSTGEFARVLTGLRRSIAEAGRTARWPIREYYYETAPRESGRWGDEWEVQAVLG